MLIVYQLLLISARSYQNLLESVYKMLNTVTTKSFRPTAKTSLLQKASCLIAKLQCWLLS